MLQRSKQTTSKPHVEITSAMRWYCGISSIPKAWWDKSHGVRLGENGQLCIIPAKTLYANTDPNGFVHPVMKYYIIFVNGHIPHFTSNSKSTTICRKKPIAIIGASNQSHVLAIRIMIMIRMVNSGNKHFISIYGWHPWYILKNKSKWLILAINTNNNPYHGCWILTKMVNCRGSHSWHILKST